MHEFCIHTSDLEMAFSLLLWKGKAYKSPNFEEIRQNKNVTFDGDISYKPMLENVVQMPYLGTC